MQQILSCTKGDAPHENQLSCRTDRNRCPLPDRRPLVRAFVFKQVCSVDCLESRKVKRDGESQSGKGVGDCLSLSFVTRLHPCSFHSVHQGTYCTRRDSNCFLVMARICSNDPTRNSGVRGKKAWSLFNKCELSISCMCFSRHYPRALETTRIERACRSGSVTLKQSRFEVLEILGGTRSMFG